MAKKSKSKKRDEDFEGRTTMAQAKVKRIQRRFEKSRMAAFIKGLKKEKGK